MAEQLPKCSSCPQMQLLERRRSYATRAECHCLHPLALETFLRVCPDSPRMPRFIDYTAPWGTKPKIKTSPKWCPLRPENMKED